MNKHVLVTGGAGYIGSHACKALAAAGFLPVTVDSLVRGNRDAVRWGPLVEADILDRTALDAAFAHYAPLGVMHFAAFAYVGESVSEPTRYYENNVGGTLALLDAMRRHQVDKLVFSSTCATYGLPRSTPIDEEHTQQPVNPYGWSKLMSERILRDVGHAHGLRSISLRYFNAAGADPDGEIGEAHDPETHLIPLILDAAMGQRASMTIHGDEHPTRDGTCIRDFVHVADLADAHVLALDALLAGAGTTAYNLANGQGFSVREVLDAAVRVTGSKIPFEVGPARPGDPPELVGDASKAMNELGWQPRHGTLDEILATAWRWHTRAKA